MPFVVLIGHALHIGLGMTCVNSNYQYLGFVLVTKASLHE